MPLTDLAAFLTCCSECDCCGTATGAAICGTFAAGVSGATGDPIIIGTNNR